MRFAGSPTHNSASRDRGDLLPHQLDGQDPRGLHGHHGGRGAAHAGGAPHLRVDAGPARPEPGRPAGFAATGGGRAEEPGQGGNAPARADKGLFMLAPAMSFIPALLTFPGIPFATPLPTPWGDVG